MDNLGRITGASPQQMNIAGSSKSFNSSSSLTSINTADSFQPSQNASPGIIKGVAAVGNRQAAQKKQPVMFERASLLQPMEGGGFAKTTKFPCDGPDMIKLINDEKGESHYLFTSGDGRTISLMSKDGSPEIQVDLPGGEKAGQMEFSDKDGILYVKTDKGVHTFDPFTLSLKDSLPEYHRRMTLDKNGNVILAKGKKLRVLDSSLKEKSSGDINFTPDEIKFLPDGTFMATDYNTMSSLLLKDKQGNRVFEKNNLKPHSTVVADDGNIFTVEAGIKGTGKEMNSQIVRYEPETGKISTFIVPEDTDSVIPLKDKSFIAHDDLMSHPRLMKLDKDGKMEWNITFEEPGTIRKNFPLMGKAQPGKKPGNARYYHFLRQTYVSKDEKQMFLVLAGSNDKSYLYKVDMEAGGSSPDKTPGKLSSRAAFQEIKELYHTEGDDNAFIPMILDDGKIVIFEEQSIHLLSPDGKELENYRNIDELKQDISGAGSIARRVNAGATGKSPLSADKETLLKEVENIYGEANPSLYTSNIPDKKVDDLGYSPIDSTLNFSGEANEKTALEIMGMKDGKELEDLKKESALLNFAFAETIEVPLTRNPGLDKALIHRKSISVCYDPTSGKGDNIFNAEESGIYSTVLPVTMGNRNVLFAGTSDGILHQYDMNAGEQTQSYDLGASVNNIRVADGNKILASTAGGGVFCLEPRLNEGERIEGEIHFSDLNTSISTGGDEKKSDKVIIDKDTRVVTIGGVQLPIKGHSHFYIR